MLYQRHYNYAWFKNDLGKKIQVSCECSAVPLCYLMKRTDIFEVAEKERGWYWNLKQNLWST